MSAVVDLRVGGAALRGRFSVYTFLVLRLLWPAAPLHRSEAGKSSEPAASTSRSSRSGALSPVPAAVALWGHRIEFHVAGRFRDPPHSLWNGGGRSTAL